MYARPLCGLSLLSRGHWLRRGASPPCVRRAWERV